MLQQLGLELADRCLELVHHGLVLELEGDGLGLELVQVEGAVEEAGILASLGRLTATELLQVNAEVQVVLDCFGVIRLTDEHVGLEVICIGESF